MFRYPVGKQPYIKFNKIDDYAFKDLDKDMFVEK